VLAAELLRSCAGIDIDHTRADHGSIDLSQVVSTEDRADNVAILRGPDGRVRFMRIGGRVYRRTRT